MALGLISILFESVGTITDRLIDDYLQTRHRLPCLPDIFQLSRHGLLCECRCLSSKMGCWPMSVKNFPSQRVERANRFYSGPFGFYPLPDRPWHLSRVIHARRPSHL